MFRFAAAHESKLLPFATRGVKRTTESGQVRLGSETTLERIGWQKTLDRRFRHRNAPFKFKLDIGE
jgi:hypothetical protein